MNSNQYFPNPNNIEFYDAMEKALKSLKTKKWRYNRRRQNKENEEEDPPNRHRQIDNDEVCVPFLLVVHCLSLICSSFLAIYNICYINSLGKWNKLMTPYNPSNVEKKR